jgi:hypothetical protein
MFHQLRYNEQKLFFADGNIKTTSKINKSSRIFSTVQNSPTGPKTKRHKIRLSFIALCIYNSHTSYCPNVSTTPLRQWEFRQCLPFSWTTLLEKHCRHPIAVMGVVDTFEHYLSSSHFSK